jgi:hypothetical protein
MWDLERDAFTFRASMEAKPVTRRGVLSISNSLYDPLGLVAPVLIKGKILLRAMTTCLSNKQPRDWDEQLSKEHKPAWESWCQSLTALADLKVPRPYSDRLKQPVAEDFTPLAMPPMKLSGPSPTYEWSSPMDK